MKMTKNKKLIINTQEKSFDNFKEANPVIVIEKIGHRYPKRRNLYLSPDKKINIKAFFEENNSKHSSPIKSNHIITFKNRLQNKCLPLINSSFNNTQSHSKVSFSPFNKSRFITSSNTKINQIAKKKKMISFDDKLHPISKKRPNCKGCLRTPISTNNMKTEGNHLLSPKKRIKSSKTCLRKSGKESIIQNKSQLAISKKDNSIGISQAGTSYKGVAKTNQDSCLIIDNVIRLSSYCLYGVMDGHGSNGRLVSQYIAAKANEYFNNHDIYNHAKCCQSSIGNEANCIFTQLSSKNYTLIRNFYSKINKQLRDTAQFDVHFSGSTCVIVFQIDNKLIISNIGDSRAILVRENNSITEPNDKRKLDNDPFEYYEAISLTTDHKPENQKEKERIERLGGSVCRKAENDHYRVYLKGQAYPGLAISRTLGDIVAEKIGVISEPDIISLTITDNDRYIVLASDGVWEFLNNEQVMHLINPYFLNGDIDTACKCVISESSQKWLNEDVAIDDITIIIAILNSKEQLKEDND